MDDKKRGDGNSEEMISGHGIIYNIYKKQKIATSAHKKYLNENH